MTALRWPDLAAPAAQGWDHLLVDQNEPKQRIAELERKLAEQKRGTDDLLPAGPDQAAAARRVVATTPRLKSWLYIYSYASLAALAAVMYLVCPRWGKPLAGWSSWSCFSG